MIVIVDEDCRGMFTPDGLSFFPLDCQLGFDPISGLGPIPCYFLPQPVVAGDVVVLDRDTFAVKDLLRFPDDGTGTSVVVYFLSDNDDPLDQDPADVGIPDSFQDNAAVVVEIGPREDFQYFVHVCDPGTYIGISDRPGGGQRPTVRSRSREEIFDLLERRP
jgi:hypothetical protein